MNEEKIEEIMVIACDQICKYPDLFTDEDRLLEFCGKCPLAEKLEAMNYERG